MTTQEPPTDPRLTIPEELLLLGWDDARGRNRSSQNVGALLGGALLLELDLLGHVHIDDGRVHPTEDATGQGHLDRMLDELRGSRRPRKVKAWVQRVGHRSWPRRVVLDRLVERGILRRDRRKFLGIVPYTRYPVIDREVTDRLRQHVADTLLQPEPVTVTRDAMLGALLAPAGGRLLRRLVPTDRRRDALRRAKELSKGEGVSQEVAAAIDELNAAAIAAAASGAAVTSASSG